jgi:hypothetical protein
MRRMTKTFRRRATFWVGSFVALLLSFNAGLLTDYFFIKHSNKLDCAVVMIKGDGQTDGQWAEDTLIIVDPVEVRCAPKTPAHMQPPKPQQQKYRGPLA